MRELKRPKIAKAGERRKRGGACSGKKPETGLPCSCVFMKGAKKRASAARGRESEIREALDLGPIERGKVRTSWEEKRGCDVTDPV